MGSSLPGYQPTSGRTPIDIHAPSPGTSGGARPALSPGNDGRWRDAAPASPWQAVKLHPSPGLRGTGSARRLYDAVFASPFTSFAVRASRVPPGKAQFSIRLQPPKDVGP